MYDYVLQYGFHTKTQDYIQNIKNILRSNNVADKERKWLPHITLCTNDDLSIFYVFILDFSKKNTCFFYKNMLIYI